MVFMGKRLLSLEKSRRAIGTFAGGGRTCGRGSSLLVRDTVGACYVGGSIGENRIELETDYTASARVIVAVSISTGAVDEVGA